MESPFKSLFQGSSLQPRIVGATGDKTKVRVEFEDLDGDGAGKTQAKTGIPSDIRRLCCGSLVLGQRLIRLRLP